MKLRAVLHGVRLTISSLLWLWVIGNAAYILATHEQILLKEADSAPMQAAGAAILLLKLLIPYVTARGFEKLTVPPGSTVAVVPKQTTSPAAPARPVAPPAPEPHRIGPIA
jgi:hypothetical protein